MALLGKLFPTTALALVAAAGSLGAQAKNTCEADATKGNLAKAAFTVEQARSSMNTPGAPTILASAVKQLEAVKGEDATVQALFLGQTLAFWLSQPNMSLTPRRGTLGFVTNPDAPIDLVTTIDSLFSVVEKAKPGCVELTSAYRGGLGGYLAIVNSAINALNAEKLDSAEYFATRANRLYAGSPYGALVLGTIASKRNDQAKAAQYWEAASVAAERDTVYRDVQRQVLTNMGAMYLGTANTASGEARTTAARKAIEAFTKVLAVPGTVGQFASSSRYNLQSALLLVGDTTGFVASYQPLLSNPSAYSYQDLVNSAVNAARANRSADAARLFEATLAQNPYHRDALYNLAVMQLALDQNEKVPAVVERLIALDPGNPENYNLAARAFLARAKAAKTAKKAADEKTFNESTMAWYGRGSKLPAEVVITEFNTGDKQVTIGGTVTDRRGTSDGTEAPAKPAAKGKAAAKPAAPSFAPTPVTLKIEALDKAGAVLGTQTVTTEALTPGKSAQFRTTIAAAGAVAYRYTFGS